MSLALHGAIVARVRGTETLTGDAAEAHAALVTLFGGTPEIRKGATASTATLPCITFYEDSGIEALGGVDVGEVRHSVYRFFIWTTRTDRTGTFIHEVADALERLFNQRRGAPGITLADSRSSQVFWCDLFVSLQEPEHEDNTNEFYGMIAFRFVEARP